MGTSNDMKGKPRRLKRSDLFLTQEQCKHLTELGLDMSDACYCWIKFTRDRHGEDCVGSWEIKEYPALVNPFERYEIIPTYTLQELLSKFPAKYHDRVIAILTNGVNVTYGQILEISRCTGAKDEIFYGFHYGSNLFNGVTDPNPLQAAYKMYCWLFEGENVKENKK